MRFWAREFSDNHMLKDTVVEIFGEDTRTHKVFSAIEKVSYEFDLPKPIWLDSNVNDFKRHSKVKFGRDSFIEDIDFDYLEFMVLDED